MTRRKQRFFRKGEGERHPHPAAVLFYTKRLWYLLLIPALRGLYYGLTAGPDSWTDTLWMDFLAVGGVLAFGWFCWLGVRYRLEEEKLVLSQGLVFRRERRIPLNRVHGLALRTPLILNPFSLSFLSLKTLGGRAETPDFSLLLSQSQASALEQAVSLPAPSSPVESYRPRARHVALFSLLCSNSLGGVLLLGALLSRGGSLIGQQLERQFAGALEEAASVWRWASQLRRRPPRCFCWQGGCWAFSTAWPAIIGCRFAVGRAAFRFPPDCFPAGNID